MLDDRNDLNRDFGYRQGVPDELGAPREDTAAWAPLAVLALFLVIGGFLWFNTSGGENTRTAANNTKIERSTPAPTPPAAKVNPAPPAAVNPAPPATTPAAPPQ